MEPITQLARRLREYLGRGELDFCIQVITKIIRGLPSSPFHLVLDIDFTNDPVEIAALFDHIFITYSQQCLAQAIYAGMNGFYINPDRWYFEIDPCSGDGFGVLKNNFTLTGMEELQKVYQEIDEQNTFLPLSYGHDPDLELLLATRDICDLLVVYRFVDLVRRSAVFMTQVNIPIITDAHDYDLLYPVVPLQNRH
jgi:hypothetical protein